MYTQKKTIENVHIVRERDRERFREMLAVLLLAAPVGLFLLLFTWQNLQVIQLGREATERRRQREELELTNRDLRFRIQKMTSLDRVEEKAREIGLSSTDSGAIVTVRHPSPPKERIR
jgi:cell division protein FtsB